MGRNGKHLRRKHIRAVRLFIITEHIQVKSCIPQNDGPVKRRPSSAERQITAVSVKSINSIPEGIQHRRRDQPLPPHGDTDVERILRDKLLRLLIRQEIAVRLVNRNPVLLRQHRQPFIPRHLILFRHLRADRDHQIHRADLLLNKADDILRCILHAEHHYLIFHTCLSLRFTPSSDNAHTDNPAYLHIPSLSHNCPERPAASPHTAPVCTPRSGSQLPPDPRSQAVSYRLY